MATFGQVIDRIEDEIARTDLTDNVKDAIRQAIRFYQRETFYFTEDNTVKFETVSGQEYYSSTATTAIADLPSIEEATITISGNQYPLTKRTHAYIESASINPDNTGQPQDFSYYNRKIRLYPIPDASYTVQLSTHPRLAAFGSSATATGSSNVWTIEAEDLIRGKAKEILYRDVIRDPEGMIEARALVVEQYEALKSETARRATTNHLTPTHF